MPANLLSARLLYGLLLALFSAGGPPGEEATVLVDQFRGAELVASYLVTEELGAVAVAAVASSGPPESVAVLDRVPGASHLYTEIESERVYSLATFFAEEYRLHREAETRLSLPAYPEAMVLLAEAGTGGNTESTDSEEQEAGESPQSGEGAPTPREMAISQGALPREEWFFRSSGELYYVRSAGADWLLVARGAP